MLLCGRTLLVVRFPQVFVPQTSARKDFAHWFHLFGKRLEMALFFPEFEFRTRCVRRILWRVPPKRSISFAQISAEQTSWGLNFEIHNLGPFFLSELQLLLEYSLSSTSCWVSPHHQHVDTSNYCHECTCFQACNYDTREDVENHTTIFYILPLTPPHRQGILAPVAGLASGLSSS